METEQKERKIERMSRSGSKLLTNYYDSELIFIIDIQLISPPTAGQCNFCKIWCYLISVFCLSTVHDFLHHVLLFSIFSKLMSLVVNLAERLS